MGFFTSKILRDIAIAVVTTIVVELAVELYREFKKKPKAN